jgi:hypothetical protein
VGLGDVFDDLACFRRQDEKVSAFAADPDLMPTLIPLNLPPGDIRHALDGLGAREDGGFCTRGVELRVSPIVLVRPRIDEPVCTSRPYLVSRGGGTWGREVVLFRAGRGEREWCDENRLDLLVVMVRGLGIGERSVVGEKKEKKKEKEKEKEREQVESSPEWGRPLVSRASH